MSDELKEVIAIIRPEKWRVTQQAAFSAGAEGASQHRVLGRGRQAGLRYLKANQDVVAMGYLPKRYVSFVVAADRVKKVVEEIIRVNKSGNPGDGKIFVCPVLDAVRIRTGERGPAAISQEKGAFQ